MKNNSLTITNNGGNKLVGIFNPGKGKKLIIICNGHNSTKEHPSIVGLAEGLNRKGYDVFRFDFSGTGESEGIRKIFIEQQVGDLDSVVNYFKKYKTIILLGGSLGALPAAIVSILNKKVTNLVAVNGFFGGHELGKLNKARLTYSIFRIATILLPKYRKDYEYFKNNLIPEKIKIPTLVLFTKNDKVVSPIQSKRFYSKLTGTKNKKLLVLPLLKHNLSGIGDVEKIVNEINF